MLRRVLYICAFCFSKSLKLYAAETDCFSDELVLFFCDLVSVITACVKDVVDHAA